MTHIDLEHHILLREIAVGYEVDYVSVYTVDGYKIGLSPRHQSRTFDEDVKHIMLSYVGYLGYDIGEVADDTVYWEHHPWR